MITRTYKEILDNLTNYTIANQDKITDFNNGSVLLTQYEAYARILERFYIDVRNGFANNLIAMAYSIFDFKPKKGLKATVGVKFSRAKSRETSVTIQPGVKVSGSGLTFETGEVAIIKAGELESNIVMAQAVDIGLKYNIEAKQINVIETIVPTEVIAVTNPKNAYGGADNESETATLERFKLFLNGLQGTNEYGLKSAVLGIEGVRSLSLDEHFPPIENIYNVTLYIDDGAGGLTPSLKNSIMNIINGDGTSSNPGKRAPGINVRVLAATVVPIKIVVSVKVYRTEDAIARAKIQTSIEEAINNLKVDDDVILTSIIMKLRRIPFIKDISVLTLNGKEENVKIPKTSIAKLESLDITVENI